MNAGSLSRGFFFGFVAVWIFSSCSNPTFSGGTRFTSSSQGGAAVPQTSIDEGEVGITSVEDLLNEDVDGEADEVTVRDPFEPANRAVHWFNDRFYAYLLDPFTQVYSAVLPDAFERGIGNAFTNLRYPQRFASNVLQGKWSGAGRETGKFLLDSTVGMLGFFNASSHYEGLSTEPEDLGQTLGAWGVGNGPYLVVPFLGPHTLRDATGRVGDGFLDPLFYVDSIAFGVASRSVEHLNDSPSTLADYWALKEGSLDPYIALRDAYIQSREQAVRR